MPKLLSFGDELALVVVDVVLHKVLALFELVPAETEIG
jgi:hypothetical protein